MTGALEGESTGQAEGREAGCRPEALVEVQKEIGK